MEDEIWQLKNLDIFDGLSEEFYQSLEHKLIRRHFYRDEIICTPEDMRDKIYILNKGEVRIYFGQVGKKVILDVLRPGDVFGDMCFCKNDEDNENLNENYFAKSATNSFVLVIIKGDFLDCIKGNPELAWNLIENITTRLDRLEKRIGNLVLNKVGARLVCELVRYAKQNQWEDENYYHIKTKLTHEEISEMIGASREATTRAINELRLQGVILDEKRSSLRFDKKKLEDIL